MFKYRKSSPERPLVVVRGHILLVPKDIFCWRPRTHFTGARPLQLRDDIESAQVKRCIADYELNNNETCPVNQTLAGHGTNKNRICCIMQRVPFDIP